ncbi:MAG: helix-turn-helix domain-containing protein [Clostridia bacterium]|nr:helix-turn-helix domain-containing protein [Clostridia bacterium]
MLTVEQVSKKWGISSRRVRELCSIGRINGVLKIGRSYLIPDDAEYQRTKRVCVNHSFSEKSILIICKNDNFLASGIAHNFIINEYEVYCNKKLLPLVKNHKIKHISLKNITNLNFKLVIFVDENYKFEAFKKNNVVYIGSKRQKDCDVLQIIHDKIDISNLTYHGKILFSESGVIKEMCNLLQMKIQNKIKLPLLIEISDIKEKPNLIKKFSSIQDSYNFFIEQYKTFDKNDKFYTVAIFNDVEFSDSNQELDYLKHAIEAFEKGVQAYIIYIYDEKTLPIVCKHFSTRLYLKHANYNSGIYMINKKDVEKLNSEYLNYIDQGIICYSNKSVYHDAITEFSLGYVNAHAEDLEYCEKMCQNIVSNSIKIKTLEELEVFYELHR